MKKQIYIASTILMACLFSPVNATTTAAGSVLFNFNVTPDAVTYGNANGFFGGVDGVDALFDASYSNSLQVGNSSVYANWDSVTGNATDYGLTSISADGSTQSRANINYAIFFTVTTDVLSFSYDYDYLGQREGTSNFDNLAMGVQVEISGGNDVFYTDYASSHPTFQTNWAYFETEGTQTVLDEAGAISFVYGDPGVVRTWFISLDVLASGKDSVGAVPLPATLPLLLGCLALLGGFRRIRT